MVVLDFSSSVLDLSIQILPLSVEASPRFPEVGWIGFVLSSWLQLFFSSCFMCMIVFVLISQVGSRALGRRCDATKGVSIFR